MIVYVTFDDNGRPAASTTPQSGFVQTFDIDEPREGSDPSTVIFAIDMDGNTMLSFNPLEIVEWADGVEAVRIEQLPIQIGAVPTGAHCPFCSGAEREAVAA